MLLKCRASYLVCNLILKDCRTLYSAATLGLDNYMRNREKTAFLLKNIEDNFRKKMREIVNEEHSMVFTEDLKNVIHICSAVEEDLILANNMMEKFHSQHKGLRFGNFVFGPVVMRMYHYLKCPDNALQAIKNEKLDGFFNQETSYKIALDLLYEEGRYDSCLNLMDEIVKNRVGEYRYPTSSLLVAVSACYKINTNESLNKALEYITKLGEITSFAPRRIMTVVAGLALKQEKPHIALEILGQVAQTSYFTVKNLKSIVFARLGRFEESLSHLKSFIDYDLPEGKRPVCSIAYDVIDNIEAEITAHGTVDHKQDFKYIKKTLKDSGSIVKDSLDNFLLATIEDKPINARRDRRLIAASFNRNMNFQQKHFREGLMERE